MERGWRPRPARTEAAYLRFFAGASRDARVFLDSSVFHINSAAALRQIRAFNGDAKIIVMIRHPAEMLASFHAYACRLFIETVTDFEKAWNLQTSRAAGRDLPPHCEFPCLLQYRNLGCMGQHVATLLEIWPRAQVKFVFFDEFVRAPLEQYKDILEFIGIPYDGRTTFPRVNESVVWKSRAAGRLMLKAWPIVIRLLTRAGVIGAVRRREFWMFLWRLNTTREQRVDIDPMFRQRLVDVFRDDIELLSATTGRNLDHWVI